MRNAERVGHVAPGASGAASRASVDSATASLNASAMGGESDPDESDADRASLETPPIPDAAQPAVHATAALQSVSSARDEVPTRIARTLARSHARPIRTAGAGVTRRDEEVAVDAALGATFTLPALARHARNRRARAFSASS